MLANILHSKPFLRIGLQDAFHHISYIFGDEARNFEVSIQDLFVQIGRICVFKGQIATNESEKDDSHTPNVNLGSMIALSSNHFRCSVTWRSAGCLQSLASLVGIGETKIDNFHVLVVVEKQIFRLQISVHNIELVQVFDTGNYLVEKLDGLRLFDPLILDNVVKKFTAGRILHYQIQLLGSFNDLVQLNNVRMSNHFEDVDFASNPFHIVYVHNFVFFKNFHGNTLPSQLVYPQLDLSKSSFANGLVEYVVTHIFRA